jgi:transposase InsO family protein
MPWENRTVKEQRKAFVEEAETSKNFSALCREYGITRATGYKWIRRYQSGEEIEDRSRRPHSNPNQISAKTEAQILALREENPGWGARRIQCVMERSGCQELPCVKTVNNVLNRHGCISAEESAKRRPYQRFEKEQCNEMWQTDFKGEFRMGDQQYCYPLTILDDRSRFSIAIVPRTNRENVVIPAFQKAFSEYGLPDSVLSDNGAQFAGFRKSYTQFEKWLMMLDILPIHGRFMHPQTQGKIERFHRTMKQELLNHISIADLDDAEKQFSSWREKYNFKRPHEALGMRCPGEVYHPSSRKLPASIPAFTYGGEYHIIKVNSWGYVRFDRWQIFLSGTMRNEYVEFRPNPHGDSFFVCFRNFKIAEFDANSGELISRFIARL